MGRDGEEQRDVIDGNSKVIIDTLRSLHAENKADIKDLDRKIDVIQCRVGMLPCAAHVEKFRRYDEHLEQGLRFRLALIPMFISLVGTVIAGIVAFTNVSYSLANHVEWGKERMTFIEQEIARRCQM